VRFPGATHPKVGTLGSPIHLAQLAQTESISTTLLREPERLGYSTLAGIEAAEATMSGDRTLFDAISTRMNWNQK